tara:strand:- start:2586 stop:2819 length:234 start_codon:yes stop_codon:yes gene_type:complete
MSQVKEMPADMEQEIRKLRDSKTVIKQKIFEDPVKKKKVKKLKPKPKVMKPKAVPKGSHRMPDGSIMKNSAMKRSRY